MPSIAIDDEKLRVPADRPAGAVRFPAVCTEPRREEGAAPAEEMGSVPWEEHVFLRRAAHPGQTERCPSSNTGPYRCHQWPFLCFRVSPSQTLRTALCSCNEGVHVCFIFNSCPFLVEHLTVFIPVIGGVLFVFVVTSLLRTSFTDPGILPRATAEEAADIERQIGKIIA